MRDGKLFGVVSRADSIRPFTAKAGTNTAHFDAIMGTTVEQIMSWHVITVELDATLDTVVHLMGAYDYESFPIVDRQNRVRASLRGTTSSGRWPATLGAQTPRPLLAIPLRRLAGYSPAASAIRINSETLRTPVLAMRLARYTSTVRGLMLSS